MPNSPSPRPTVNHVEQLRAQLGLVLGQPLQRVRHEAGGAAKGHHAVLGDCQVGQAVQLLHRLQGAGAGGWESELRQQVGRG